LAATIGVLTIELHVEDSHSLKDKRHVVKSLKDRLRSKFNVAVAEIDGQDTWQWAVLAAVTVASSRGHCEQMLQAVEDECASQLGGSLRSTNREFY
jgi:uncharacterized protein YlxP (DUF503 family)